MVNSLWFKWRSLRLPWRKSFMVGQDLAGNTFWEFKDVANANRFRRIVKFDPKTHYGDVQVTHVITDPLDDAQRNGTNGYDTSENTPPSLEEQRQDLIRQAQMKQLAQLADERWASKPSVLDKPKTQQPAPATQASETTANPTSASQEAPASQSQPTPNPWAQADRRNPGDGYQPDSWTPTSQR